jgi:serine protease inhibitor
MLFSVQSAPRNIKRANCCGKAAKQIFDFLSTRKVTRVLTKDTVDCHTVEVYFENTDLALYTFHSKSKNYPNRAQNTPTEDVSDWLMDLSYDVISVKHKTTARRSPEDTN